MSERYTRKDAEAAFTRLARALGKDYTDEHGWLRNPSGGEIRSASGNQLRLWNRYEDGDGRGRNYTIPGAWTLDYAAPYGGFVIHEMAEGGGVSTPLGSRRRVAREFCSVVEFTLDAIRILKP